MKKILALILCSLILMLGVIGCKPKVPPDPNEGLYGVYKLITGSDGMEVRKDGDMVFSWPEEVQDKIDDVLAKAGDTITITKEKISFSGGSMEREFEYEFTYWNRIFFDNDYFPFYFVNIESFTSLTPTVYQLRTRFVAHAEEETYSVSLYYSEYEKFN